MVVSGQSDAGMAIGGQDQGLVCGDGIFSRALGTRVARSPAWTAAS